MNVLNFDSKLCERTRRQLDAYVSNELLVETTGEVVRHLESCEDCAAELQSRMRVRAALRRASMRQMPPVNLSQSIHQRLRRAQPGRLSVFGSRPWALALAAMLVVVMGGIAGQQALSLRRSRRVVDSILALGVSDHVNCALREHNYPGVARSEDELRQRLPAECAGLLPVVEEKLAGFELLEAHVCSLPGSPRKYVHFIARREGTILSVILTKRDGESLPRGRLVAADSAANLYRAHLNDVDVAGFECKSYFGFVVAGIGQDQVLEIARDLAPPVRNVLDRSETATEAPPGVSKSVEAAWRL
jgi:anti-sigma factor RsiW